MRISFADLMKRLLAKKGTSIPNFDVTANNKNVNIVNTDSGLKISMSRRQMPCPRFNAHQL